MAPHHWLVREWRREFWNRVAAQLQGGEIDAIARNIDQAPVELRIPEVHRILGKPLPVE